MCNDRGDVFEQTNKEEENAGLPCESALLWEHCIFESVVVATSKFTHT